MAKMTKAAGRKRALEIRSKAFNMLGAGFLTMREYEAIDKICKASINRSTR